MSDEEQVHNEPAPPPPKKKKKKKRRAAIAAARAAAAEASPARAAIPSWTNGHLAAALAAGVALGGLGGYAVWGQKAASDAGVAKDSASQAPTRGAQATTRPQPPPEPATPVHIPLAAWSPREGPEHAKVTILEFSDFQ